MSTLFKDALVVDGAGNRPYISDVLVDGNTIKTISTSPLSGHYDTVVDAKGKILCPGFMDIHSHSDLEVLRNPTMPCKIQQGITFDVSGNCGIGVYPKQAEQNDMYADILGHSDTWDWTDFSSYARHIDSGINIAFLQSHSCLRNNAISGNPNRKATEEERKAMCQALDLSLSQGCIGLSTGLYYAPCLFADRQEMIDLLKVVKKHNALFTVHHRCEGNEVLDSIDEVLSLVRETGVRLQISHLKAIGRKNQDKVSSMLEKIHSMLNEGYDIAFDQYPYEYGSTSLFSLLPPTLLRLEQKDLLETLKRTQSDKALRDSIVDQMQHPDGWDSITELVPFEDINMVILESSPAFNGLSIAQASQKMGLDPYDALFTLLSKESKCALMTDVTQTQESMRKIFDDPLMVFGTDSLYAGEMAHPRSANAAIHLLEQRCIKEDVPFEVAIAKMTGKVALRLGITDRGLVKEGYKADLVLFDPAKLRDNSDSTHPFEMCSGLEAVMVNGVFALKDGKLTKSRSGEVIYRTSATASQVNRSLSSPGS